MTKAECNIIYNDTKLALQKIADACGLDLEVKPGSFDSTGYMPKVTFRQRTVNGVPRAEADFKERAFLYGLSAAAYGATVQINREAYRVLGFAANRSKYPLHVERISDGKRVFATYDVIERLAKEYPAPAEHKLIETAVPNGR